MSVFEARFRCKNLRRLGARRGARSPEVKARGGARVAFSRGDGGRRSRGLASRRAVGMGVGIGYAVAGLVRAGPSGRGGGGREGESHRLRPQRVGFGGADAAGTVATGTVSAVCRVGEADVPGWRGGADGGWIRAGRGDTMTRAGMFICGAVSLLGPGIGNRTDGQHCGRSSELHGLPGTHRTCRLRSA